MTIDVFGREREMKEWKDITVQIVERLLELDRCMVHIAELKKAAAGHS